MNLGTSLTVLPDRMTTNDDYQWISCIQLHTNSNLKRPEEVLHLVEELK